MASVTPRKRLEISLHEATPEVAEEFERILKEQVRLQDDPDNSSDAHEATGVKESARPRREKRTWRSTGNEPDVSRNEHARAERHVNDGIGSLCEALQAAARAAHSLTCCLLDRESNETKYLRKGTELIEEWQIRFQS